MKINMHISSKLVWWGIWSYNCMEMRLVAPVTPVVLFFLSALRASLTRLRRERSVSIRKKISSGTQGIFDAHHYLKKPSRNRLENFESSLYQSNVLWVDIHSTLTICLFYTRCLKERQKKESIFWGSNQLCAAVLVFINVQLYPISHKTYP